MEPSYLDLELMYACTKLLRDVLNVRQNENVVIYADTASDQRVVKATGQAAHTLGAVPTMLYYETRPTALMEPPKPVAAAMKAADVLVEYAVAYTLYTKAYSEAVASGARYICLAGMDVDMAVRCIGKVNYPKMIELGEKLVELTKHSKKVEIRSPAGSSFGAEIDVSRVSQSGRIISKPGEVAMLGGQVSFAPVFETVNGRIVFDGALWPPFELGVLREPISLEVEEGKIREIAGGSEAKTFQRWLQSFDDKNMFNIAHFSYGFNPGAARPTGKIVEDERIFGSIEIGVGHYRNRPAKSHSDGIVLNPTIKLDDNLVEVEGGYLHPDLAEICRELGRA